METVFFEKKKWLSPEDEILTKTEFEEKTKKIISFCVLQVSLIENKTYEIIKFDTAHGFVHVHRFYQRLNHEGEALQKEISPQTLEECKKDIKDNWRKYRQWHLSKLKTE
jgi:hypothetical protein